jgi:hypothetical protein
VLLVELEHADLCERQRFGGLPRLVERAVHRSMVLLILASLREADYGLVSALPALAWTTHVLATSAVSIS